MAFDESLASRIRPLVSRVDGMVEKKMFGGLAFLLNGNMSVGVHASELIVRIDPASRTAELAKPGVRMFEVGGRTMKGWILVAPDAIKPARALAEWVKLGLAYAGSLPAK